MKLLKEQFFIKILHKIEIKSALSEIQHFVEKVCAHRESSHNHAHMEAVKNNATTITKYVLMIKRIKLFCLHWFVLLCTALMLFKYDFVSYVIPIKYQLIIKFINSIICGLLFYTNMSKLLFCKLEYDMHLLFIVQCVAWLHDVADHKYVTADPELKPALVKFLDNITSKYEDIFDCMSYVESEKTHTNKILAIIERISYSRQNKLGCSDWLTVLGENGCLIRDIVSDADKWEAIGKKGIERCKDYIMEHIVNNPKCCHDEMKKDIQQEVQNKMIQEKLIEHYNDKLKLLATTKYMKTIPGFIYAKYLDRQMKNYLLLRTINDKTN
jgi:hypothetical protein